MTKKKDQKKKERERRVAQKKIATATKRRALEKLESEPKKTVLPELTKRMTPAVPKADYVPTNKKSPFTQRRSSG